MLRTTLCTMLRKKLRNGFTTAGISVITLLAMGAPAAAQQEEVLFNLTFAASGLGCNPQAGFIKDSKGNLYGATGVCGPGEQGTVFALSRKRNGAWGAKVLHAFLSSTYDGQRPLANVVFDKKGNLYGTTYFGGKSNRGTVYELMPQADGTWQEQQLYSFRAGTDGQFPRSTVIFDSGGNLYGTTTIGGTDNTGTAFELMPQANGAWKEKILHNFLYPGTDGFDPEAGLVLDAAGNLYGTTAIGGLYDRGTVFELTPGANGDWTEKILYNFTTNADANFPNAVLTFDAAGNLYGTTAQGGLYGWGTVFELSPGEGGEWAEKILFNFANDNLSGTNPYDSVIFDSAGNLYGTAQGGGLYDYGVVFKLIPSASGDWAESVLYNFGSYAEDAAYPGSGGVIFGPGGGLYGTTINGGTTGYGTIYEITP